MAKKRTTEGFKQEVKDLVGNEYTVLGEYINNKTKIAIRHKCGKEYDVRPDHFLGGSKCPVCSIINNANKRTKSTEQFKSEVYEIVGEEYSLIGEYASSRKKVSIKHNICGQEYKVYPHIRFLKKT